MSRVTLQAACGSRARAGSRGLPFAARESVRKDGGAVSSKKNRAREKLEEIGGLAE